MKILFVCTGNTCRSPMAEGIMKKLIIKENLNIKIEDVKSVGLITDEGMPVSANSVKSLKKIGIDISDYTSSVIEEKDLQEADIVLTMTEKHWDMILQKLPQYADKVFTLSQYVENKKEDIKDPYGGNQKEYDNVSKMIIKKLKKLVKMLKEKGY